MCELSVIIPVYNVENYVERCIRSVAEQDIDADEYEILIINDGSTDGSLSICETVAQEYSNVHIHSQKNTGLGGARNKGVALAKGEYVWFIDSDDFIKKNVLSLMFQSIKKLKCDVLAFDFNCTDETGKEIDWINFKLQFNGKNVLTGTEFYNINYYQSYIWLYLFKRTLFTDNNIFFKERINMQDSELMPRLLYHVKSIGFLDRIIYSYVNRENSFINNKNPKVRLKYYHSIVAVANYLNEFKNSLPKDDLIIKGLNEKLKSINKILFEQFIYNNFDNTTLRSLIELLKKNNLYPFTKIKNIAFKKRVLYGVLRFFVNKKPLLTRRGYLSVRNLWNI